jgi:hypothetical protein
MLAWWKRNTGQSRPQRRYGQVLPGATRHFKTKAAFTKGSTVAVDWYDADLETKTYVDSGEDGEVTDMFAWFDDVDSGTKGVAEFIGLDSSGTEVWDIAELDCP